MLRPVAGRERRAASAQRRRLMSMAMTSVKGITSDVARINGVPLHVQDVSLPPDEPSR